MDEPRSGSSDGRLLEVPMKHTVVVCLLSCLLVPRPSSGSTDAVLVWNENAGRAAIAACTSPFGNGPAEARLYAMTHVAIHDALNAIDRRSRPYAYDDRAKRGTSPAAAVAAAARGVLVPASGTVSAGVRRCRRRDIDGGF